MSVSESLDNAEELFCDKKYDESDREFRKLLNEAADEDEACRIADR